jgi:chromosome segregation ATPase
LESRNAEQARADALAAKLEAMAQLRESVSQQLVAEQTAHAAARTELDGVRRELLAAQAEVEKICAGFAEQLDKFRQAAAASEDRHQAIERRTLLDLDQERTRNGKLSKQLEQTQARLSAWMDQQAQESTRLQGEINLLRERAGELEGRVAAARDDRKQLEDKLFRCENELKTLRQAKARPLAAKRARRRVGTP